MKATTVYPHKMPENSSSTSQKRVECCKNVQLVRCVAWKSKCPSLTSPQIQNGASSVITVGTAPTHGNAQTKPTTVDSKNTI
jgi:hypothetical protein